MLLGGVCVWVDIKKYRGMPRVSYSMKLLRAARNSPAKEIKTIAPLGVDPDTLV